MADVPDDDDRALLDAIARARLGHAIGHTIVVEATLASTQDEARARAERGAPHGTVVVALRQTAGRGRRGRAWIMLDGALACSVVLRPRIETERLALLTQLVAAALCDALVELGVAAFVKWPNDVLVADDVAGPLGPYRKVAGILVESAFVRGALDHVVVGLGVNVRGAGEIPRDLVSIASALDARGRGPSRAEVLAHFLGALEALLDDDIERSIARALATCRARSATLGRRVRVDEASVEGVATAIDDDGALVVTRDDGTTTLVRFGDVVPAS